MSKETTVSGTVLDFIWNGTHYRVPVKIRETCFIILPTREILGVQEWCAQTIPSPQLVTTGSVPPIQSLSDAAAQLFHAVLATEVKED
ncbi:MAG: hypothetical protein KGI50_01410 [Patescibacteria group bacterium]|nr:hypothetical protein [Patescibacteria group bacterium]MDE2437994.1 hypothetical protein [Patescibacteria group bacterium]